MKVYFDNAATTPLDPEVFEAMKPLMLDMYGNPLVLPEEGPDEEWIPNVRTTPKGVSLGAEG